MKEEEDIAQHNSGYCVFVVLLTQWTMAIIMGINATALNPLDEVIAEFVNSTYLERYSEFPPIDYVKSMVVISQSALVWGSFAGALLVKVVINYFSRKGGVAMTHVVNIISVLLMSPVAWYGKSYEALIVGRALNGLARGIGYSLVAVVAAETTTRRKLSAYQGPYTYLLFIGAALGVAIGHESVCGNTDYWPILTASSGLFSVMYLVAYPWLPQTPGYFLLNNKNLMAKECLRKLRQGDVNEVQAELSLLEKEIARDSRVEKVSIWGLMKKSHYRKQMTAAVLTLNCTQFVGIQAMFFYSNTLFREAGVPDEYITYASIAIFAQCIIPGAMAIALVQRIGTRKMFISGNGIVIVGLIIFTAASAAKSLHTSMPYVALSGAVLFLFGNYFGIQITTFTLPSELTTQVTRPAVMSVGSVIYWVTATMVGTLMPYTLPAWGPAAYVPFIILAVIEFMYGIFILPDTFNKTSEEIQRHFESKAKGNYELRFQAHAQANRGAVIDL